MTALPKVSIVIPVYNGSDYVSEAIDSALAQTYPNIEVLAINDGSNDQGRTEGILGSYGSRIRYINKPNGGVASALNVGIREMEGVYFSWLSHDDLYLPEKVQVQMEYALKADRPTVYYSDFETIDEKGQFLGVAALPHVVPTAIRPALFLSAYMHGCSLLIPRQAFDEVGLFDESLRTTQDYDLWFKMAVRFPFEHVPKVLVRARLHKDQGTHRLKDPVIQEINDLYRYYITALTEDEIAAYWPAGNFSYFMEAFNSMEKRGFGEAAGFALNLACAHVGVEALRSYAKEHESQIQTLQLQLNDARQNATLLLQELERICGSMSWRMTAPLRAGRRVLVRLHTVLFRPSLPAPHAPLPDDRTRTGGRGDRSA